MELDYLREFVALAKTCKFQETANQLFMSQSSLSKHIKAIEKDLGAELLDRSTRHVELTEFGAEFLPYAEKISEIQQDYVLELLPKINNQPKSITIGVIPLVTLYRLNTFPEFFAKRYPNYTIEFVEHNGHTLLEMLRAGECDIIVASEVLNSDDNELHSLEYTIDTLVAVLPESHPLASQESISAKDLANHALIQVGKLNLPQFISPDLPQAALITSRVPLLMDFVLRDMGIGILTKFAAKRFQIPGVIILPIEPLTEIHLNMYFAKPRRKSFPVIQTVQEYLRLRDEQLGDKQV